MRSHITKGLKVFIFFAIGIVILYLLYQRQDAAFRADCAIKGISAENCSLMSKIKDDISNANYYWVSITMMLFMLTNILRALRWKMMFVAIGYRPRMINLVGTIMINYLANLGIPRSGEVIRAGLLSGYEDIPIEKVLGTIFTDRIFDVMMLLIVIVLAMFFGGNDFLTYLNQNINIGSKLAGIFDNSVLIFVIIALMILSTVVLWKSRTRIMSTTPGQKLVSLFTGFADGVKSVANVSSVPLFLFYTVAIWFIYYLMVYFAFFTFSPTAHLGPIEGLVAFVFGSLGILIPTPGGMGSFHYLMGEALSMYGISGADAFSFANIVFFSINIFLPIVFGLLALIMLPAVNKD